jgi:pimeloyl-ACP methyl ester carboxylesterase
VSLIRERRYHLVKGYRVHSVHAGAGDPIVLLHGLSGSHRWWLPVLEHFAARYSVHMPELVGFGGSRPARAQPSIPEAAELVLEWLDVIDIERCALVGHSMGGQIAIHIAARAPDRLSHLVLVSAAGIPRPVSVSEAARFVAEIVPPRAWGELSFLPVIALDAMRSGPLTILQAARNIIRTDVRPLLSHVSVPTLIVWGSADPLTPVAHGQQMQQAISGAKLVVIDGAAHVPMVDRPREFASVVTAFIESGRTP